MGFFTSDVYRNAKDIILSILPVTALGYFSFLGWHFWGDGDNLYNEVKLHAMLAVGVPIAGVVALFLVIFFEKTTEGQIELKALGFEFKGPSGPAVLWVICFLAIVVAMKAFAPELPPEKASQSSDDTKASANAQAVPSKSL